MGNLSYTSRRDAVHRIKGMQPKKSMRKRKRINEPVCNSRCMKMGKVEFSNTPSKEQRFEMIWNRIKNEINK